MFSKSNGMMKLNPAKSIIDFEFFFFLLKNLCFPFNVKLDNSNINYNKNT